MLGLVDDMQKNRFTIFRSLTLLRQLAWTPSLVDDAHAGVRSSQGRRACSSSCSEVVAEGHRALVFSQFTGFLGTVRDAAGRRGHRPTPTSTARTRNRRRSASTSSAAGARRCS